MTQTYHSNPRHDVISLIPNKTIRYILEVGGGDFNTLDILVKQFNSEGWGVDQRQPDNSNHKILVGSFESDDINEKLPKNYFDLVMANDVIEHLHDSELFFKRTYEKLNSSGLLLISVPNIRQVRTYYNLIVKGSFLREDAGLFDKTHLRWFCKSDVLSLAANAGYKLINYKSVGRLVPDFLNKTSFSEFLALQNIFLFEK